eukprot:2169771-Pleurochrysis_carterae.AAC.1
MHRVQRRHRHRNLHRSLKPRPTTALLPPIPHTCARSLSQIFERFLAVVPKLLELHEHALPRPFARSTACRLPSLSSRTTRLLTLRRLEAPHECKRERACVSSPPHFMMRRTSRISPSGCTSIRFTCAGTSRRYTVHLHGAQGPDAHAVHGYASRPNEARI